METVRHPENRPLPRAHTRKPRRVVRRGRRPTPRRLWVGLWIASLLALPAGARGEESTASSETGHHGAAGAPPPHDSSADAASADGPSVDTGSVDAASIDTADVAASAGEIPEGTVFGRLEIDNGNVFDTSDPEEDHWFFRLANRLHRKTRPGVIRQQLLFAPGDPYSEIRLEESERLLRSNSYLYDVEVRPGEVHDDGAVDVTVHTRDVWTLEGGLRFGRQGGKNSVALHLEDSNLLGLGMGLTAEHKTDVDRTSNILAFRDPYLLGTRATLEASIDDSDDGGAWSLGYGKPFESIDTRWAGGFSLAATDRVDSIYSLGHVVQRFRHRSEAYDLSGGRSRGAHTDAAGVPHVLRWRAGLAFRQDRFEASELTDPTRTLPEDRTLVYPWVGVELLRGAYATTRDQDQLDRTEDQFLGRRFSLRLGYAPVALGSDRNASIFELGAGYGRELTERRTIAAESDVSGRWAGDGAENVVWRASGEYYQRDLGQHLLMVSLEGALARRLDAENQVLLGGDSGLRGYPLRYQSGDAKLLLTVEQRFFTNWYPMRLLHVGAAAFFDIGRTWGAGVPGEPNLGLLKDLGVGLRLAPSRSAKTVLHFDIAAPLDGDPSIGRVQWLVKSKTSL